MNVLFQDSLAERTHHATISRSYLCLLISSPLESVAVKVQLFSELEFGYAETRVPSVHRETSQREFAAGICFTRNLSRSSRRQRGKKSLYVSVAAVYLSSVVQRLTSIETRSKGLSSTVFIFRTKPKSVNHIVKFKHMVGSQHTVTKVIQGR